MYFATAPLVKFKDAQRHSLLCNCRKCNYLRELLTGNLNKAKISIHPQGLCSFLMVTVFYLF